MGISVENLYTFSFSCKHFELAKEEFELVFPIAHDLSSSLIGVLWIELRGEV